MPTPPELPEKASGIKATGSFESERRHSQGEDFDVGRSHARAILRACQVDPSRIPEFAEDPLSAAEEWALSGAMSLTGAVNGPPDFANGPLASAARGAAIALEALLPNGSLSSRTDPGRVLPDPASLLGERAAIFGLTRRGDHSAGGSARLVATRDAPLAVNLPRDEDWHLLPAWLAVDSATPAAPTKTSAPPRTDAAWAQVESLIALRESKALLDRGRLMGLAVAPAPRSATDPGAFFHVECGSEQAPPTFPAPSRSPARRLRLLDLSTLWAGPLATSILARVGIDVLKVESPTRPDGARRGPEAFFDLMNGGKRGCALDLRDSRDRGAFERLLSAADLVVESARPRALAQLGYDAESWVGERPGRIWTSITGYGRAHEWIAFGDDAAAAAGLSWSPSSGVAKPRFCADAVADPLTGLHVAAIILGHLRSGRGGLLDISLSGIAGCAASAPHSGITLPLDQDGGEWVVRAGGRVIPVAPPRARPPADKAPALLAPDESLLADWTGSS
jgi:hypothetical protein